MELREVKRHMNRTVQYSGSAYELTAIIFRRDRKTGSDFYQAEITDKKNDGSVLICRLEQIESEGKP